jgi:hypothetical protein
MTVIELIEALEALNLPEAEVALAYQPAWPLAVPAGSVRSYEGEDGAPVVYVAQDLFGRIGDGYAPAGVFEEVSIDNI